MIRLQSYNRLYGTIAGNSPNLLKEELMRIIPSKRQRFLEFKKNKSDVKIGDITVGSILGGMRGNNSMFWETTTLSPTEGIKFHNLTIQQCQEKLPGLQHDAKLDKIFLPESMLWLLMTGQVPTLLQTQSIIELLNNRVLEQDGKLPPHVENVMNKLPKDLHPMTQLSIGLSLMNRNSTFAKLYQTSAIGKNEYWDSTFDDVITLIANLPLLTGKIYSNLINNNKPLGEYKYDKDWSYNICSLLGMTNDSINKENLSNDQINDFVNLMRLYTGIHVDHEGGNVSAHTTHLVGSALTDPFLSYASGINGLAGPLHGLAAQEVVRFIINLNKDLKGKTNDLSKIEEKLWNLLNSNKVIPGYGHAVLRKPDPRFSAMLNFALQRPQEFENDKNVQLMKNLSKVAPKVLMEHGKCKNPYPNVDSASGVLFYHYGIKELLFFTVIFGCSRAFGPLTQLTWDRVYGLPIERPKSLDLKSLQNMTV